MLAFVEQLSEVNVEGVEPMTSVTPMQMKKRQDVVNDGEIADDIVANAPARPKVTSFLCPKWSSNSQDAVRCACFATTRRPIRHT
ncbi:aspartyl/glutamyl-tRNA(Asn/Gln) amidotransferase C subunit [Bradyrhizobium sp. LM6.10]